MLIDSFKTPLVVVGRVLLALMFVPMTTQDGSALSATFRLR